MSTMSLEAEKNALIRQILDVDDIAILKKIRSMLNHEEEQVRVNDWMGTGSIYIVDTYCRQRRIHLYFPKCTASQILDNRMRG